MRITIDTSYSLNAIEFKTLADWKEFAKSWTRIEDGGTWQWGTYVPKPYAEPHSFPCLMLYDEGHIITNPNGRDWYLSIIIEDGSYKVDDAVNQ